MKGWLSSVLIGMSFLGTSPFVLAQTQLDGVYIGAQFGSFNSAELDDVSLLDVKLSGDFVVGYHVYLEPSASIALETNLGFLQMPEDTATTFSLNFKPKFTVWESDMYLAPLIGISALKDDSNTYNGYQYGLELGYQFGNHFILSMDYVIQKYDVNALELEIKGFNLGLSYQF